jgi:hypothetical protein
MQIDAPRVPLRQQTNNAEITDHPSGLLPPPHRARWTRVSPIILLCPFYFGFIQFQLSRPERCTEYWESNLTVKIMVEAEKRHGPSLTRGDNINDLVIDGQRSFSIPCALSRQVQRPSVRFPKTSALDVFRDRSTEVLRIIKLARNLSKREVKGRMVAKIGIHRRQTSSGDLYDWTMTPWEANVQSR